jgi:hypothetical protein
VAKGNRPACCSWKGSSREGLQGCRAEPDGSCRRARRAAASQLDDRPVAAALATARAKGAFQGGLVELHQTTTIRPSATSRPPEQELQDGPDGRARS